MFQIIWKYILTWKNPRKTNLKEKVQISHSFPVIQGIPEILEYRVDQRVVLVRAELWLSAILEGGRERVGVGWPGDVR